ncbi:hypothetical protein BJX64DRAFT_186638 [Aspergillus heterothallicus]
MLRWLGAREIDAPCPSHLRQETRLSSPDQLGCDIGFPLSDWIPSCLKVLRLKNKASEAVAAALFGCASFTSNGH